MKKFFAISALALFTFYWWGYLLVFQAAEYYSTKQLSKHIESGQYDQNSLITLTVDLELPYAFEWAVPEQISGKIVVDGIPYTYVERIYQNGKMTYKCLPDLGSLRIGEAKKSVEQMTYEAGKSHEGKPNKTSDSFAKKLIPDLEELSFSEPFLDLTVLRISHIGLHNCTFPTAHTSVATPPPDLCLFA